MSQSETSFPVTTGLVKEFVNVDSRGFALSFAVTAMVCVASGLPQKSFLSSRFFPCLQVVEQISFTIMNSRDTCEAHFFIVSRHVRATRVYCSFSFQKQPHPAAFRFWKDRPARSSFRLAHDLPQSTIKIKQF